ncbi:hypothetical protein ACIRJS_23130 [Streptomyces sp. NPDC102340]|uniref:hypothetical protein n=1 Tax=unclassified Streptomyces TaxID=2593676 RepID=UPI0037FB058D
MAEPVTDADCDGVRRLHGQGLSRNAIARQIGRSASTVTKIAKAEGLRFDGGARMTGAATEARRQDLAAVRTEAQHRLYARALANLVRVEAGHYVRVELLPTGQTVDVVSDDPPAHDERHHAQAIASYLATAQRLAEVDAGRDADGVRSALTELGVGIRRLLTAPPQGDEPPADAEADP